MTIDDIVVEVQIVTGKEKLRGHADVTLPLEPAGFIQLLGCSIVEQQSRGPVVFCLRARAKKKASFLTLCVWSGRSVNS